MKLSVTIITLNEEKNITRALNSVNFADEIIVADSGSQDKTVEIARKLGAKVFIDPFMGYGQHKNYAASLCQGEWILNIDADEAVSPELAHSILEVINKKSTENYNLYKFPRLTYYCEKPIHHGGWYPDYKTRLCRKNFARWTEPHVHENLELLQPGPVGKLKGDLIHYSFPSVYSQLQVNLKYATLGAREFLKKKGRSPYILELIFRPLGKFIECYFIKKGFLDGIRGFIIAVNAAHSLFMKYSIAYMDKKTT